MATKRKSKKTIRHTDIEGITDEQDAVLTRFYVVIKEVVNETREVNQPLFERFDISGSDVSSTVISALCSLIGDYGKQFVSDKPSVEGFMFKLDALIREAGEFSHSIGTKQ